MKTFKSISVMVMFLILATTIQAQDAYGSVKDIEGNVYKTVKIGDQWWMAENLRTTKTADGQSIKGYFYNNDEQENKKFGRLYTWKTAMNSKYKERAQGIAPDGWHIPSDAEWQALYDYLKTNNLSGRELLKGGKTGFNALLEGGADFKGRYLYKGLFSMYWSSTAINEQRANHHGVNSEGKIEVFAAMKGARIHVRCIKDK